MSAEAPGGCRTVGHEVATEENLSHILCDPTCLERQALGISKDNTPLDIAKRENEWLRRLCILVYILCCSCAVLTMYARSRNSVGTKDWSQL
jgi:hypothetical protein